MAEKEEKLDTGCGVCMMGGKFYCSYCEAEVPEGEVCATCLKEVDWDKVKLSIRAL